MKKLMSMIALAATVAGFAQEEIVTFRSDDALFGWKILNVIPKE